MPVKVKFSIERGTFGKDEGRYKVWFWLPTIYSYRSSIGPRFRVTRVFIGWLRWGLMFKKVWSNPVPALSEIR
jgi:hypothetical protein